MSESRKRHLTDEERKALYAKIRRTTEEMYQGDSAYYSAAMHYALDEVPDHDRSGPDHPAYEKFEAAVQRWIKKLREETMGQGA